MQHNIEHSLFKTTLLLISCEFSSSLYLEMYKCPFAGVLVFVGSFLDDLQIVVYHLAWELLQSALITAQSI